MANPIAAGHGRVSASAGEVSASAPFRGALQRAILRAPRGSGGREATVSAAYPAGGAASRHEVPVALSTGAPVEISALVAAEPVPLGASVPAVTAVKDARGDAVGAPHGPPALRGRSLLRGSPGAPAPLSAASRHRHGQLSAGLQGAPQSCAVT